MYIPCDRIIDARPTPIGSPMHTSLCVKQRYRGCPTLVSRQKTICAARLYASYDDRAALSNLIAHLLPDNTGKINKICAVVAHHGNLRTFAIGRPAHQDLRDLA